MTNIAMKQRIHNRLNLLFVTTSERSTGMDSTVDLFIFILRYSFLLNNTSKPQNSRDPKTPQFSTPQGNIYMGARYLDPKYSRWISVDPALAEYIPGAGKSDEADKLPGMGGIYNSVNGNLYHYAGNNPVRYLDPDGREDAPYNISFGNHDLLPTFKGIDTGDKWYNNLWDGFVSYCLEGTYNLVASSINLLNNGIFSGFELYETGINWLDENWSYNLTFSGNGVKADLEMFSFVSMANPLLFYEVGIQTEEAINFLNININAELSKYKTFNSLMDLIKNGDIKKNNIISKGYRKICTSHRKSRIYKSYRSL